jgi:aminobenzoyl-glutamate utilization protein B
VAGIPTAWTATWGEGGPLIALGSDLDDLRGVSQIPGSPKVEPMVPGGPGHGEGHNSGMPLVIAAALAAKAAMEKHHIKGRLLLWPGIAEELLGSKAYYVREGLFKNVDACIFAHVDSNFGTFYGPAYNGLVSVEYTFHGKTAHAAADPWDGHSALDAVEIMNVAMNYRREHLPLSQRTHYVVSNGGGQPNIVPGLASVWYYFRDYSFDRLKEMFDIGNRTADGDRHDRRAQDPGLCRAQLRQQAAGRTAAGQYRKGRHAQMERRRPGFRQVGPGDATAQG